MIAVQAAKRARIEGAKAMEITKAGSAPTRRANADWFTGTVWQDPIVEAPDPACLVKTSRESVRSGPGCNRSSF